MAPSSPQPAQDEDPAITAAIRALISAAGPGGLDAMRQALGAPAAAAAAEASAPPERPRKAKYAKALSAYAEQLGFSVRALKRWIQVGKAGGGDLPPLDEPSALAAWWARNMKHRVPEQIAAIAGPSPQPENPTGADPSAAPPPAGSAPSAGWDIEAVVDLAEGEEVRQARQLVQASWEKLKIAYAGGLDNEIRLWSPRWERAMESLRKVQASDREARKARGELLSKAEVSADLAELLSRWRFIRESLDRRVDARLVNVPEDLREQVRTAIRAEQAREDGILRKLHQFGSNNELEFELVA